MGNTQKKTEAEKTKWQNILRIYKRDFKNILHNPVALLITVGLLVLPSLYAWVNIVACWDPYGNTNGIKVAVVNMDQGVTLQGNTVNAGDEIVKNLRENDAIGWQFVSEEDAEYGLTHDRYYAMLEIPENFSSQLVNVLGDNYEKPQIIYRVNEKSNAIAPKITDTGAKTVTNEVTKAIIEVVDKVAFAVGNDVGEQIDTHEGKIKMLRDTVLAVNDNFGELEAELEKANAGLTTIEELLASANETVPVLQDGIDQLQDFSAQGNDLLGEAEQVRTDGVTYIDQKFAQCQQLIDETQALLQEARGKINSTEDLVQEIPPMLEKAEKLQQKLTELLNWLQQQDIKNPDYDKWLAQLQRAEAASEKLIALLQTLEQNPEQIQQALVSMYGAADVALTKQQAALELVEQELRMQLAAAQTEDEKMRLQALLEQNLAAQEQLQQSIAETKAKEEHLAALAPDEIVAEIEPLLQDAQTLQQQVQKAEAFVKQAKEDGLSVDTVLQELERVDDLLGDGIAQVRSLLQTADKAFALSNDIMNTADETLLELEQMMQDVTAAYQNRWSATIDAMFGDLHNTLGDLDVALNRADDALPKVSDLLQQGGETEEKGAALLLQLNEAVPEAKAELQRLSAVMAKFSDKNLDTLISLLENDTDAAADYFSGPVELKEERLYHLDNYGSAMAPFYTVLAFWVGCLLLCALLTTETAPIQAGRPNTMMEEYFGKMLTFLTLAVGQSLIVALGDKFILGVTVADLSIFLLFSVFTAFIFILIVYTMVSILGAIGKAICVVFLVLQIAGAGGTFPVEVMPEFYQIIQPYLPFTYAIGAMREAISGPVAENLVYDFWHLLIFGSIALLLGVVLKKPLHPLLEWFNRKFKESGLGE